MNSIALCHGSKANNVHHSNQKLLWKKWAEKQSTMRLPSSRCSGSAMILTRSMRSRSVKPMVWKSGMLPSRFTSRTLLCHGHSALARSVSSRTEMLGSLAEGIESSRSKVH
ncbi:hypothetical protein D9M73_134870 [compost metagenome]